MVATAFGRAQRGVRWSWPKLLPDVGGVRYVGVTGRFTQPDPIGIAGGLNLYGYAAGDPINRSDPFGLSADTLRIEGESAAVIEKACAARPECEAELGKFRGDSANLVIRDVAPSEMTGRCAGTSGCFLPRGAGGTWDLINLAPANLPGELSQKVLRQFAVPASMQEKFVGFHEVAHAALSLRGGYCNEYCASRWAQTLIHP